MRYIARVSRDPRKLKSAVDILWRLHLWRVRLHPRGIRDIREAISATMEIMDCASGAMARADCIIRGRRATRKTKYSCLIGISMAITDARRITMRIMLSA